MVLDVSFAFACSVLTLISFLQIVSFLMNMGAIHKHLKISIMLYLETYSEVENLFTSMAG